MCSSAQGVKPSVFALGRFTPSTGLMSASPASMAHAKSCDMVFMKVRAANGVVARRSRPDAMTDRSIFPDAKITARLADVQRGCSGAGFASTGRA